MISLFSENIDYKLYNGNMLDMLEVIERNSIDSIITDPPYGLTSITKRYGKEGSAPAQFGTDGAFKRLTKGFMGKEWDGSGIEYNIETWKKCYDVLKDGGYLLAFGGSRTFHRIACAIEDAGFEIRDTIMWLYGSGFPKSMNIGLAIDKKNGIESKIIRTCKSGKADTHTRCMNSITQSENEVFGGEYQIREAQNKWKGWGTALKPSFEPIIVARKPFKGSLVDNVIENGVGGINIDECRVGSETISIHNAPKGTFAGGEHGRCSDTSSYRNIIGRFPANTILTYDETDFEEVCSGFPNSVSKRTTGKLHDIRNGSFVGSTKQLDLEYERGYNDSGSTSRYFYCAKASAKDRDEGLENFERKTSHTKGNGLDRICEFCGVSQLTPELCHCENKSWIAKPKKNIHPTVKPTELMQYLVRLVTPDGGTVLDPFNGSGSTGKAVMYENKERDKGYKYIGIELTEEYLPISKARIEYVWNLKKDDKQISLFNDGGE